MSDTNEEFAWAARALLAEPFITRGADVWPAIVAQHAELVDYFEDICGWTLNVDARRGSARLHKRRATPDPTRALRRDDGTPLRRSGYALVVAVAAELVSRPTTTVGDLADNVAAASLADTTLPTFDATVHAHRLGFVDALRWFVTHGFVQVTAGDLDRYRGGTGDAVVVADLPRFSELLATSTPPSRVIASTTDDWVDALAVEPRYQLVVDGRGDADAVNRHARHLLGRALLDDPCVNVAGLDEDAARYLTSISGRAVLRAAVERAGFIFEESSDVLVAVDTTGEATDRTFGRTADIVTQVAVTILDHLTPNRDTVGAVAVDTIETFVIGLLAADDQWAASYQRTGGAHQLTREALDVLVAFDLVTIDDTGPSPDPASIDPAPVARRVRPAPSASRFTITVIDRRNPTEDTP